MVAILARPNDPRVLVQFEGDLSFEGESSTFEYYFGAEFVSHDFAVYLIVFACLKCYTFYKLSRKGSFD